MTEYRVYILYRTEEVTKSTVLVTDDDNKLIFPLSEVEYRVTKPFSFGDLDKLRDEIMNGNRSSPEDEFYNQGTRIEVEEYNPKSIKNAPMGIVSPVKIKETMTINDYQLNLLIEGYKKIEKKYEKNLGELDTWYVEKINEAAEAVKKAEEELENLEKTLKREKGQLLTPSQTLEEIIRKLK